MAIVTPWQFPLIKLAKKLKDVGDYTKIKPINVGFPLIKLAKKLKELLSLPLEDNGLFPLIKLAKKLKAGLSQVSLWQGFSVSIN